MNSGLNRHQNRMGQIVLVSAGILAFLMGHAGCKNTPTNSTPMQTYSLAGTYVGSGNLGGSTTNILMEFIGPDSMDEYTGRIRYRSAIIDFEDVFVDETADTVWIRYRRDNVIYQAWARIEQSGLPLNFVEPSGISSFRVNRETGGYNMSGDWLGEMTSTFTGNPESVEMLMDQQGQLYYGTLNGNLPGNPIFTLNSGVSNGNTFQLTGTVQVLSYYINAYIAGYYLAPDTIQGNWQAGDNPSYDHGEFYFIRSFD